MISLGYAAGALYRKDVFPLQRQKVLLTAAGITLALFFALRSINLYGDKPWQQSDVITQTLMSYFNITKYPPSLLFLCLTLGIGLCLLTVFERQQQKRWLVMLASFGAAPMFFYLLHLYVLKGLYLTAVAVWGKIRRVVRLFRRLAIVGVYSGADGRIIFAGSSVCPPESPPPRHPLA
nr:hypothetical protein KXZ65_21985 [Pectobacterium sp. PL152]